MVQPGLARQIVDLKTASSNLVGPVKIEIGTPNQLKLRVSLLFYEKIGEELTRILHLIADFLTQSAYI